MVKYLLREKAYHLLKQKIVRSEYAIGEQLVEPKLCQELEIGRTPVREALQQLASENLVKILPRKGVFVNDINIVEWRHLLESRIMIEVYCARKAVTMATAASINGLRALFDDIDTLVTERSIPELLDIDNRFHMGILALVENPVISEIGSKIYNQLLRTWFVSFSRRSTDEILTTTREHLALLDAIETGQPDLAERHVMHHLKSYSDKIGSSVAEEVFPSPAPVHGEYTF